MDENRLAVATGGPAPIGPDPCVLEMHVGPGKKYDPARDVIVFMPALVSGVIRTFMNRDIPILVETMKVPGMDQRVGNALGAFMAGLESAREGSASYADVADVWMARCNDPEAVDLVLKVFGRALVQFYVECVMNTKRPEAERWPCNMETVIDECLVATPYEMRASGLRGLRAAAACLSVVLSVLSSLKSAACWLKRAVGWGTPRR